MLFTDIEGKRIPLVSIGTSPFFGAGQFGIKALFWRQKFLHNPEEMANLMMDAYDAGSRGAHIIPLGKIPAAAGIVKDQYSEFVVIGSTPPNNIMKGIEILEKMDARIIFVHGQIADLRSKNKLSGLLSEIRNAGAVPGIATHEPIETISFIENQGLDCPAILVPFNSKGYAMQNKPRLERMINSSTRFFIGMKVLAAGKIRPKAAFEYVGKHGNISAVTIGITTSQEAKESVHFALKCLNSGSRLR
ncbi:MAG: hypothetical protein ACFFBS_00515 [Promethearchaeota archaeon]